MSLGAALVWKYGPVVSCNMDKGEITSWRHETLPEPDPSEFAQILADYNARPPEVDPDDALDEAIIAANNFGELKAALLGRTRGRK